MADPRTRRFLLGTRVRRDGRWLGLVGLLLISASCPRARAAQAPAPSAAEALAKCQRAYEKVKTYASRFTFESQATRPPTKVSGRILLKGETKARVEVDFVVAGKTYTIIRVVNGDKEWEYDPFTQKTKTRSRKAEGRASKSVQFLPQFTAYDPAKVSVVAAACGPDAIVIEMPFVRPRERSAKVRLWIERRTWSVRRIQVLDGRSAPVASLSLTEIELNAKIDDSKFRFMPK